MTTKNMALVGLVAALLGVTGLLIRGTLIVKSETRSTTDSLRTKQTEESLDIKPLPSTARATREALPAKAEDNVPVKLENPKPSANVATVIPGKAPLKIILPKPNYQGTPKPINTPNLEPDSGGKARDPILVPLDTKLISKGCKVTSSEAEPIIGELGYVTDGDKDHDGTTFVELGPNIQWVQIDLGKEKQLFAACVWHFHGEPVRIYFDVVCQISNDPDFIDGVQTAFNNDHDNSSKLGQGRDKEYNETNMGRPFAISGVKGRYVRFYSRGNTSNAMNHYTEIELYGKEL